MRDALRLRCAALHCSELRFTTPRCCTPRHAALVLRYAMPCQSARHQVRYIINLATAEARAELTRQTLDQMRPEELRSFATIVARIADNLAVQRDASAQA